MNNLVEKILIFCGSTISIGFGVWHFFVPKIWRWNSYIDPAASELTIAVRTINIFFSLSLVLFGIMNVLLLYGGKTSRYALIIVLSATCILWVTRVLLQIIYPQGSVNLFVQYGMLAAFIIVLLCYSIPLILVVRGK